MNCTSWIEARITSVRSLTMVSVTPAGMARCRRGSSSFTRSTVSMTLAPGLALDVDDHRRLALIPGADLVVLQPVDDLRHVGQQHRRAVAIGDHQRLVGVDADQLVVGGDGVGLVRAVERALGTRDVGADDRLPHVLEADAVGGEPRQIGLDAHRRPDAALDRDAADAADFGEPARHQRVGKIAHFAERDGRRR